MKIGIIGTGTMGGILGKLLVAKGHQVLFGSRQLERAEAFAHSVGPKASSGSYTEANQFGDVVLLVTAWQDTEAAIQAAGSLAGKILIDCTNPESDEAYGLVVGHVTSGAEEIARWAKGARVVKAFNHVYGSMLEISPQFGSQTATVFYCGDDTEAKNVTASLISDLGLEPVDAGSLRNARQLEPLAQLAVQLAEVQELGGENIAFNLLRR